MSCASAEQVAEEVVVHIVRLVPTAIGELFAHVWTRAYLVSVLVTCAERIERRSLLRILEHVPGFADLLESLFGVRVFVKVRMKLARELTMSSLDLRFSRRSRYAHDSVIVLVSHRFAYRPNNRLLAEAGSGRCTNISDYYTSLWRKPCEAQQASLGAYVFRMALSFLLTTDSILRLRILRTMSKASS
ncbi:hypothetical protein BURKHO8Y_70107 [Burkholderia sp. 8Y]|nr:hypothetical protein BURKHO8Y_70107 [Burkholderia sp. 8Y]